MSVTCLAGGRIVDPANDRDEVGDLWIEDGRIVADPGPGGAATRIDLAGRVVMAGGIDMHSHLAGGKVNLARMMMTEDHRRHARAAAGLERAGGGRCTPSTFAAGAAYARMGYTTAFEPAMLPSNARQTHAELADTPMIDKGAYVLLGNDDYLLRLLADEASAERIADYAAWTVRAAQALAIKVVNPGGIAAFKYGGRELGFDAPGPHYGVTPRRIVSALTRAAREIGLDHPLHLHANDLGLPGNIATTLRTIEAAEGEPLHLTHVQFHSYGAEGSRGMSSGAGAVAEALRRHPNLSVDVGQVMFGQTVTASGDTMTQHRNRAFAKPGKWASADIECDAGCGVVPVRYSDRGYVNALQWTIGLELFLMAEDPWRIFLTTDHPNGAPFDTYPHLIRLLMDRTFRADMLGTINPRAAAATSLRGLDREYTLAEIAIITRAGPARSLGLTDRGHLGTGAVADVTVYDDRADRQAMFERPHLVFKDGRLVVRDGELVEVAWGATHVAEPVGDPAIEDELREHFARVRTVALANYRVRDDEIEDGRGRLVRHGPARASR